MFLNSVKINVGNFYSIPPGTIHALGRNMVVLEVQQSSDVTKFESKISNDASAAALGETKYGVGRGKNNIIMITLGTGVGWRLSLMESSIKVKMVKAPNLGMLSFSMVG